MVQQRGDSPSHELIVPAPHSQMIALSFSIGLLLLFLCEALGQPTPPSPAPSPVIRSPLGYRLTLVAGTGVAGFSGDGGAGTSASLNCPSGLALDGGGNLFIADTANHRVRQVAAGTGVITTVAGNGVSGFSGDGGPGTSARLALSCDYWYDAGDSIAALAVDSYGNLFIVDAGNVRVRRLTADTRIITTVAGTVTIPYGENGELPFVRGDGGPGTSARFRSLAGLAVDGDGNLLIVDSYDHRIRRLAAGTGIITTVAGGVDSWSACWGHECDGWPGTNANLFFPAGVTTDVSGNVLFCDNINIDYFDGFVRRLAVGTGAITTIASYGGEMYPTGVAVDADGDVYIINSRRCLLRRAADTGTVSAVLGNFCGPFSVPGVFGNQYRGLLLSGLVTGAGGNVFFSDAASNRVWKLHVVSATPSASPPRTRSPTSTLTRGASPSRTVSPTPSPTMPVCRGLPQVVPLAAGTFGVSPVRSTAVHGAPGMYTSGTCASGLRAFYPGARLLYALDLGAATPLGGALTVTTCGHSANNTVLYVGTGCPTWDRPFACVAGNDNAAACGPNAFASTLTITATQSTYFVQVGGYNGVHVASGLEWAYAPPSQSPSRSPGRTRSRTGTRSRSQPASRSRTRKPKGG